MPTSTLTSKGQTTIPLEVRRRLGLEPGDRIDFVIEEDGRVLLRGATEDVADLDGLLKRPHQKRLSIAGMNAAVRRRAGGR